MTKLESEVIRTVVIGKGNIHCSSQKKVDKVVEILHELHLWDVELDDASERFGTEFSVFVSLAA